MTRCSLLPAFFVQDFNAESVDYIPNALASKPWMNFSAFETIILLNLTNNLPDTKPVLMCPSQCDITKYYIILIIINIIIVVVVVV